MPTTVTLKKDLPANHRIVLDWLCRQPARVFDFVEVADACKIKRGKVEVVLRDLQHQRFGAPLKLADPNGLPLRARHAYLPADAPARAGYPPVPKADVPVVEHPTVIAMRKAAEERAAVAAKQAAEAAAEGAERVRTHAAYKKAKQTAREKAATEKPRRTAEGRDVTGYALPTQPLGPSAAAPSATAPAAIAPKARKAAPAGDTASPASYKKATAPKEAPPTEEPTA